MTPEQTALLSSTILHFQEVARQNRFAENNKIDHDGGRCVICHPELLPLDPLETYLHVVAPCVLVRRPRLDQDLADEINKDMALMGLAARVSVDSLLAGEEEGLRYWSDWIREALTTGLDLLSIHSATSIELSLDEAGERGLEELVEEKVREIMTYQQSNA